MATYLSELRARWTREPLGWLGPLDELGLPVLGAVWGLGLAVVWWAAGEVWPAALAAVVVVAADQALAGGRPLTAVMRTAEADLPPRTDHQRRLHLAGAAPEGVGLAAGVLVLLTRWAALVVLVHGWVLLPALWSASRVAAAVSIRILPGSGDLPALSGRRLASTPLRSALPVIGVALVAAALAHGPAGALGVGAAVAGVLVAINVGLRRRGVLDGAILAASVMVGETAGLLVAAGAL